jgi:hypothetical protein
LPGSSRSYRSSGEYTIRRFIDCTHVSGVGTPSDMLISDGLNARLTLADVKTLSSGVVILSYRPS